eukprot:gene4661-9699_t
MSRRALQRRDLAVKWTQWENYRVAAGKLPREQRADPFPRGRGGRWRARALGD